MSTVWFLEKSWLQSPIPIMTQWFSSSLSLYLFILFTIFLANPSILMVNILSIYHWIKTFHIYLYELPHVYVLMQQSILVLSYLPIYLQVYIYIYKDVLYTHAYAYMHTYTHAHIHTHTHTHTHIYIYIYIYKWEESP